MNNKKPGNIMVPPSRGLIADLVTRLKLIVRLVGDSRVNFLLKLIPIGALIYVISPIDLIMAIPGLDALDDAAVISLGAYLFVELCPPEVVNEHMQALSSNMASAPDDVVDAEATDLPDDKK